jgi:hypothetical protein
MLMGEQRSFPFAPFKQSQRAKHFQRREKVFGQFLTPANLAAWIWTVTVPQKALRQILVPVVPLIVQQRFAQAYRDLHDRFRQGQIPDNELRNLVAQLERLLEGILSVHNAMSSLLSRPKQVGKNSLASNCIGANIRS